MFKAITRRLVQTLAVAAVTAAIALPANARTLSLGLGNNRDDHIAPALEFLGERIGELSNGSLEVELFWSAQLGSARELAQSVSVGAVDMQFDVLELLATFEPRIGALSLPLVFEDRDHFARFLGSDLFGEFLDTLEAKGIVFPDREGLKDPEFATNWVRPYDRGIVANRPIFTPDDLDGFKLRMYESEIPVKSWEALGANVQIVPWPDVYAALAAGVVDGLTGTVNDNYEMKHFENAKYWTNVHEYFQMMHPWIARDTWESLTDEERAAIDQAVHETGQELARLMAEANAQSARAVAAEFGVSLITPPIAPWIEKMQPALADFEARGLVEKGLIERLRQAAAE